MKVKAAVIFEQSGNFSIEELELCEPNHDEVIVRIAGAGICHTDIAAVNGYVPIPPPPSVFGHEGSGIVEKVGSQVTKVKPGDHVVLSWDCCGKCPSCKAGHDPNCHNFFLYNFHGARPDGSSTIKKGEEVIHGSFFGQSSFADFALANERNVVKVREDVPIEILGPMGCGIQTGAGAVMNSLKPKPGSSIAVFGVGTVGISAIMAAVVCGCTTIVAVDLHAERLEMAKSLGATHIVNAGEVDPVQTIKDITGGGVEFSLECVGNPKVFRQAVDVLPAVRGVCGLVGVVAPGTEVGFDMDAIMSRGRTIKGIVEGDGIPDLFIPKLIELYRHGRFPFDRLITFYSLEDINQAIEDMEQGKVIKPILRP